MDRRVSKLKDDQNGDENEKARAPTLNLANHLRRPATTTAAGAAVIQETPSGRAAIASVFLSL